MIAIKTEKHTGDTRTEDALMLEYSRLLSQQGDTRQTPQTQKSAMLSVPAWQSLRQFAVYKT